MPAGGASVAAGVFHKLGLVHQPTDTGPGWDFVGTVAATGPDVDLPIGTLVAALVDGFDRDFDTYAEQLIVPANDTAVLPEDLDLVTAAAVPLNGLARAKNEKFIRDLDADFTTEATPGWDAVAASAALQEQGVALTFRTRS